MSYPWQVYDERATQMIAGVPARGDGLAWFLALTKQTGLLDLDIGDLYTGLADVEDAVGPVLDLVGDGLREPRGGLGDVEYRRILSARMVASAGGVTTDNVWAGWTALTGTDSGTMRVLPPSSLWLSARIGWTPTTTFRRRAGKIVRKLVGADAEVNAVVYRDDSARFDTPGRGFGQGRFAFSLFAGA